MTIVDVVCVVLVSIATLPPSLVGTSPRVPQGNFPPHLVTGSGGLGLLPPTLYPTLGLHGYKSMICLVTSIAFLWSRDWLRDEHITPKAVQWELPWDVALEILENVFFFYQSMIGYRVVPTVGFDGRPSEESLLKMKLTQRKWLRDEGRIVILPLSLWNGPYSEAGTVSIIAIQWTCDFSFIS